VAWVGSHPRLIPLHSATILLHSLHLVAGWVRLDRWVEVDLVRVVPHRHLEPVVNLVVYSAVVHPLHLHSVQEATLVQRHQCLAPHHWVVHRRHLDPVDLVHSLVRHLLALHHSDNLLPLVQVRVLVCLGSHQAEVERLLPLHSVVVGLALLHLHRHRLHHSVHWLVQVVGRVGVDLVDSEALPPHSDRNRHSRSIRTASEDKRSSAA